MRRRRGWKTSRDVEPWYNRVPTKKRCEWRVPKCHKFCKGPSFSYHMCYMYLEQAQGCNDKFIDEFPPDTSGIKYNKVPFVSREVRYCRFIKEMLFKCQEKNSNYDADWKCAPFQGYVDECIAQDLW